MESKLIDNVDEQVINSYIKGIINLTNKLPDYIKQNIAKLDLSPLSNQVELVYEGNLFDYDRRAVVKNWEITQFFLYC